ncbi:MAG: phosphoadenylyl-sulfate reductase [Calditrichaeota bacterium]|nr:phosphoadenylyl-sulfate reductase [Calditrichota bacterium]
MNKLNLYREILSEKTASEILEWAFDEFGDDKIILATAFGVESQIITDILVKSKRPFRVFTIDTGRLFQETYDVMQKSMEKYGIKYEVYAPDAGDLAKLIGEHGPNLFYESIENRKKCCEIRKVRPLEKALSSVDAWITGLRQEQSQHRRTVQLIDWDHLHGIYKLNPLANWSEKEVWDYVKENDVPYNRLVHCGFKSIGCAPCTRPVGPGEDERAGRWWWEQDGPKECGLHYAPEYQI